MKRSRRAVELKHSGMNCGQAILLAFGDKTGLSDDELKKVGAAFGIGMGCFESTCGALCGAQIVLGMKNKGKPVMGMARRLYSEFLDTCGAAICIDLKGVTTGRMLCSCDDCVANAVEIVGGLL